ncbi:MAG: hypothetical protein IKY61_00925, partial [Thermoguttaceae bacterium]|nr:hypothetical protein [Thermoguttaceae bacterium]
KFGKKRDNTSETVKFLDADAAPRYNWRSRRVRTPRRLRSTVVGAAFAAARPLANRLIKEHR